MKKRIDWIDIYKGLAIISVVLGHSNSPIVPFVYLFHMSAFIFISGFTFNFKKYNNIQDLVYEKFKRLIIPYFSFAFFFSLLQILLNFLNLSNIFFTNISKETSNPFWLFNSITSINYTNPLSGATWFLIMLFETIIFSYIIFKIQNKLNFKDGLLIKILLLLFILSCTFLYPRWPGTHVNYFLDLNFVSIFFFIFGYLFNKHQIFSTYNELSRQKFWFLVYNPTIVI